MSSQQDGGEPRRAEAPPWIRSVITRSVWTLYLSTDLGPFAQNPFLAVATRASPGRRLKFPIPRTRDSRSIAGIRDLLASGAFRPVIDRHYPLERIVDAYRYVETGRKIGNVLIDVTPMAVVH